MPWKPAYRGEVPSLGLGVLDWIVENLAAPDRMFYEPFEPTLEQAQVIIDWYALHPKSGRFRFRRGVLSRSRGWGKSPILAALCCVEALGPVKFAGWDAAGRPVGMPWREIRTPIVQLGAVSEAQTKNTWDPVLEMLRGPEWDAPVLANFPGLEPLDSVVNLPGRGRIEQITSSAKTTKGNKPVFAVLDQTEVWVPSNGGPKLATTIRINARKTGGRTIESPNAFTPGDESVAEEAATFKQAIDEGRARQPDLLYHHVEAPPDTDLTDHDSLLAGLEVAYGDSALSAGGWVDLEDLIGEIWDPSTDEQTARSDFLNQITHAMNAYVSQPEWAARVDAAKVVADRDLVTLGFDGSRGRTKGKPDATALIACRVEDGHLFQVGGESVWEAPDDKKTWEHWTPPIVEIEAAIRLAFSKFTVVGFFADPAGDWRSYVNAWEAKYGGQLKVKASVNHPIEWWMSGGRSQQVERAVKDLYGAIAGGDMTHDGSQALTRHMLNARRDMSSGSLRIDKENKSSTKKVDAATASVLAWRARNEALAKGVEKPRKSTPQRVR